MRISAVLTAIFCALALAACGGDSASTDTQAQTTQGGEGEPAPPGEPSSKQGAGSKRSGESGGSGSPGGSGPGVSGSGGVPPLQVSGGGSDQFRSEGGDNSIQEFGEEGDESELQEAAEVVHGFYVARAREEWSRACSYLAPYEIEQLERLAEQAPQLKGCAPVLRAITPSLSPAQQRELTTIDAGSLRHEGEQAFLIYHGAGGAVYSMPMGLDEGEWKVAALSASALQ
jgi:hypothetical protein